MDWIQTFTGRRFNPLAPDPAAIDVADIAHALSQLCRFGGHCRTFYCVADHSLRVSRLLPPGSALAGLLHDAAEAYVADLPRPVKRQVNGYAEVEDRVLAAVCERFSLPWPLPQEVWDADDVMLATEMRDLMAPPPVPWSLRQRPVPTQVVPLSAVQAEWDFLRAFEELTAS